MRRMQDFVTAVHARAGQASGAGQLSSRAEVLLALVLDIKNNRQRSQKGAPAVSVSSVLSAGVLRWLRGPGLEEAALRSLPWAKLLQPGKKARHSVLRFAVLMHANTDQQHPTYPSTLPCMHGARMRTRTQHHFINGMRQRCECSQDAQVKPQHCLS